jgi:hypothetical protein
MPAVQKLHPESDSHTKPDYLFGHSCQAIALLTQAASSVLALPRNLNPAWRMQPSSENKEPSTGQMLGAVRAPPAH